MVRSAVLMTSGEDYMRANDKLIRLRLGIISMSRAMAMNGDAVKWIDTFMVLNMEYSYLAEHATLQ